MSRWMKAVACLGVLGMALSLTACGGSGEHEAAASGMVDTLNDLNRVMDGVTDQASAEAAVPELETIALRMKELKAQADALGEPPADVREAVEAKYREPMEEAMGQTLGHMMRVMTNPEISAVLEPVFQDLDVQ